MRLFVIFCFNVGKMGRFEHIFKVVKFCLNLQDPDISGKYTVLMVLMKASIRMVLLERLCIVEVTVFVRFTQKRRLTAVASETVHIVPTLMHFLWRSIYVKFLTMGSNFIDINAAWSGFRGSQKSEVTAINAEIAI